MIEDLLPRIKFPQSRTYELRTFEFTIYRNLSFQFVRYEFQMHFSQSSKCITSDFRFRRVSVVPSSCFPNYGVTNSYVPNHLNLISETYNSRLSRIQMFRMSDVRLYIVYFSIRTTSVSKLRNSNARFAELLLSQF